MMASPPRACASSRASVVPPRISTRMDTLYVIGIGAGDPEYLTMQAVRALSSLDVVFVLDKGDELTAQRRAIVARHGSPREVAIADPARGRGAEAVAAWRSARAALIGEAVGREQ